MPVVLDLGYTTFESPQSVVERRPSTLQSISQYLLYLSGRSRQSSYFRRPVDFNLALGNYYQIFTWLQHGDLDGAIVSPFTAFLLKEAGIAEPIVELSEWNYLEKPMAEWNRDGHWPLVAAAGPAGPIEDPVAEFDRFLERLRGLAQGPREQCAPSLRAAYRINMVAHLSSSGFVAPILYAAEWLSKRPPAPSEREVFWACFFNAVNLRFDHALEEAELSGDPLSLEEGPERPPISLYFSYSGRSPRKLKDTRDSLGVGEWQSYEPGKLPDLFPESGRRPPSIPNDVLVLRIDRIDELLNRKVAPDVLVPSQGRQIFGGDSGYSGVRPYLEAERALQEIFRDRIRRGFGLDRRAGELTELRSDPLNRLSYRWYENGRYDFSLPEIFELLVKDQISSNTEHLALVLPGGGVKSAYQAKILDLLYEKGYLTNLRREGVASTPKRPLPVTDVVGTSGGAMIGLFTAQKRDSADPDSEYLTSLWLRGDEVETGADEIFPSLDMLRWISIYVILTLFVFCFYLFYYGFRDAELFDPNAAKMDLGSGVTPQWIALVGAGILAVTPLLVARLRTDPEDRLTDEGVFYFLAVAVCHFAISCTVLRADDGDAAKSKPGTAWIWLLAAIAGRVSMAGAFHLGSSQARTTVVSLGGLAMAAALATLALEPSFGIRLRHIGSYLKAVSTVLLFIGVTFLMLLGLVILDLTTLLELTPRYWILLGLCAVLLAAVIFRTAGRHRGRFASFLGDSFRFLASVHQVGRFNADRALVLLVLFGGALAWWNFVVAPAFYDGGEAEEHFEERVIHHGRKLPDDPRRLDLRANLVVTASNIYAVTVGDQLLPPGEIYFCFSGAPEGCPDPREPRWLMRPGSIDEILQPVFASGSPFPVFPPQRVLLGERIRSVAPLPEALAEGGHSRRPEPTAGQLIDGGYAHNVPLQAAELAGARQVLLIRSEPDPIVERVEDWFPSQLYRFVRALPSFLFARAQELDRSIAEDMLVASVVPSPFADGTPWPWLADFREPVVRNLVAQAGRDFDGQRRIGRIESWGLPVVFRKIRGGGAPAPETGGPSGRIVDTFADSRVRHLTLTDPGWEEGVRAELMKRITSVPGPDEERPVAVLDFDNTCIRNDLGEAVFLRMILDLRFRGEDDRFWALFPDPDAARRLRDLWQENRGTWSQARRDLRQAANWSGEFRDYVVLFYRQYEELLENEGGAAAYPWVVRLLVGMSPEEVRELTLEVWRDQRQVPIEPVEITSPGHGSLTVAHGLAVHSGILELISGLQDLGWEIWILTASSQYSVAAVAQEVGVAPERVVGIRLALDRATGRLTDRVETPVTYGPGKARVLELRDLAPRLVVGDSMTDFEMLQATSDLALVVDRGAIPPKRLEELRRALGARLLIQPAAR